MEKRTTDYGDFISYEFKPDANGGSANAPRFRLQPFNSIGLDTVPEYLIKDILPRTGIAVVWGPPKCGKSFVVFDLMMHIALGWEFRGHRCRGPETRSWRYPNRSW
jgi:hypothetical protein